MIDQTIEWIFEVMILIGLATWRALPVFFVVLTLDRCVRKRVPAKYVCFLWMLVVARLLMPVSLQSPLAISDSADNLFASALAPFSEPQLNEQTHETFTYRNEHGESITVRQPVLPVDATPEEIQAASEQIEVFEGQHADEAFAQQQYNIASQQESMLDATLTVVGYMMFWGWIFGFLYFACRGCFAYSRFVVKLSRCDHVKDQSVIDRVLRVCDRIGVGRRPMVKEVKSLDAPAVFGLFRPVICLPPNWREQLADDRLDWVLGHELAHVKRRDGLVLCVASIARSLHWFHPLSWIAFAKLQHHIERAADEVATSELSESNIRAYGNLLLKYAAGQPFSGRPFSRHGTTIGLLAMALPRGLHGRIESLGTVRTKQQWLVRFAMVPVVVLIALSGLTDATTIEPTATPPHQIPNLQVALNETELPPVFGFQDQQAEQTGSRTVSVNVEKALRKAEALQPGVNAEAFVKTYFNFARHPAETAIDDGVMTTLATPQQEAMMKQMLTAFEQSGLWQISTEVRIVEMDVRLLNQIDWLANDNVVRCQRLSEPPSIDVQEEWDATFVSPSVSTQERPNLIPTIGHSVSIPVRATVVSRLQIEGLIRRVHGDARSNIFQAPKVTMFNGQCAIISDVVQRPFVTDVSVVRGEDVSALQPKISVFESGWKFRLKPTVAEDKFVDLQIVITHSSIDDVKVANLPRLAANQPEGEITIQVPSVQSNSISVQGRLAPDEALLVFSPKPYATPKIEGERAISRGMGQVFMIRTQLISNSDFLQGFMPDALGMGN